MSTQRPISLPQPLIYVNTLTIAIIDSNGEVGKVVREAVPEY